MTKMNRPEYLLTYGDRLTNAPTVLFVHDGEKITVYSKVENARKTWQAYVDKKPGITIEALASRFTYVNTDFGPLAGKKKLEIEKMIKQLSPANEPAPVTAGVGGEAWRRLKAKLQRRDRYGRFAEMGGGFSFAFKKRDGSMSRVTGKIVGQSGTENVDVDVKGSDTLPDGVYSIPASKGEAVKAVISLKGLDDADVDKSKAKAAIPSDTPFVTEAEISEAPEASIPEAAPEVEAPEVKDESANAEILKKASELGINWEDATIGDSPEQINSKVSAAVQSLRKMKELGLLDTPEMSDDIKKLVDDYASGKIGIKDLQVSIKFTMPTDPELKRWTEGRSQMPMGWRIAVSRQIAVANGDEELVQKIDDFSEFLKTIDSVPDDQLEDLFKQASAQFGQNMGSPIIQTPDVKRIIRGAGGVTVHSSEERKLDDLAGTTGMGESITITARRKVETMYGLPFTGENTPEDPAITAMRPISGHSLPKDSYLAREKRMKKKYGEDFVTMYDFPIGSDSADLSETAKYGRSHIVLDDSVNGRTKVVNGDAVTRFGSDGAAVTNLDSVGEAGIAYADPIGMLYSSMTGDSGASIAGPLDPSFGYSGKYNETATLGTFDPSEVKAVYVADIGQTRRETGDVPQGLNPDFYGNLSVIFDFAKTRDEILDTRGTELVAQIGEARGQAGQMGVLEYLHPENVELFNSSMTSAWLDRYDAVFGDIPREILIPPDEPGTTPYEAYLRAKINQFDENGVGTLKENAGTFGETRNGREFGVEVIREELDRAVNARKNREAGRSAPETPETPEVAETPAEPETPETPETSSPPVLVKVNEADVDASAINPDWQTMQQSESGADLIAEFDDYYENEGFMVDEFMNPDVTDAQRKASSFLITYQGPAYVQVNKALRSKEVDEKSKRIIDGLDSLFDSAPTTPRDSILFRGVSGEYSNTMFNSYEVGDLFTDAAYASTSADEEISADVFASDGTNDELQLVVEIFVPQGSRAISLNSYLGSYSREEEEQEVLLDRGTTFRVISKTVDADGKTKKMRIAVVNQDRDSVEVSNPDKPDAIAPTAPAAPTAPETPEPPAPRVVNGVTQRDVRLPQGLDPVDDLPEAMEKGVPWSPLLPQGYSPEVRAAVDRIYEMVDREKLPFVSTTAQALNPETRAFDKEELTKVANTIYDSLASMGASTDGIDSGEGWSYGEEGFMGNVLAADRAGKSYSPAFLMTNAIIQRTISDIRAQGDFDSGRKSVEELTQLSADFNHDRVMTVVPLSAIDSVLDTRRIMSQFEVGESMGYLAPGFRSVLEASQFGYPPNMRPASRPIYGVSVPEKMDARDFRWSEQYGELKFVMKDGVQSRTTYTLGDSANDAARPAPIGVVAPTSMYDTPGVHAEAQMHGSISLDDVAEVVVRADSMSPADLQGLKSKLQAAGIKLTVIDLSSGDYDSFVELKKDGATMTKVVIERESVV